MVEQKLYSHCNDADDDDDDDDEDEDDVDGEGGELMTGLMFEIVFAPFPWSCSSFSSPVQEGRSLLVSSLLFYPEPESLNLAPDSQPDILNIRRKANRARVREPRRPGSQPRIPTPFTEH